MYAFTQNKSSKEGFIFMEYKVKTKENVTTSL
jgi:hypothetical protein